MLTADSGRRRNVRHRAEFCGDKSHRYRDTKIFDFQDGIPSAILHFKNFEILMACRVQRVKVRHCAKFRGDRSHRYRDMAIYHFFNMAAVRHIGFVMRVFGSATKSISWSLLLCKIWLESMQW